MGRRIFSREFKLEAVRLVRDRGVSVAQASRDLRRWVAQELTHPTARWERNSHLFGRLVLAYLPTHGGMRKGAIQVPLDEIREATAMAGVKSRKVPKGWEKYYSEMILLSDDFCARHLNQNYADLAGFAIAALCRKRPSPLQSGSQKSWVCAVLYALGQVNFLSVRPEGFRII